MEALAKKKREPVDLRKKAAIVNLPKTGDNVLVPLTQLGHSSVRTTERYYAHLSPEFSVP